MKASYPGSDWAIWDGEEGRWTLSDREEKAASEVRDRWRTTALLRLPVDPAGVRAAVDFAYSTSDVVAPQTIEWVDGPRAGMERARQLGCAWCSTQLVWERRRTQYDLCHALQAVAGLDRETAWDLGNLRRWSEPGTAIVDSICRVVGHTSQGDRFDDRGDFDWLFSMAALGDFLVRSNLLGDAGWDGMGALLFACGPWWWASEEAFIACRAPLRASFDGNALLHADDEPALAYGDGTTLRGQDLR